MKDRNPSTYSQKFYEPEVAAGVNQNNRLIEPNFELFGEAYKRMRNIDLNDEYSSNEHHNEHEILLSQEDGDDEVIML